MGKLFGTDGVRGEYGEYLTDNLARRLGYFGTKVLTKTHQPVIIIGKDTRESGNALESALAQGISQAGGKVLLAGVIPTPAMAVLVRELGADAAVMISASHNLYEDNGIKFFNGSGYKLDDAIEEEIEKLFFNEDIELSDKPVKCELIENAEEIYLDFIRSASDHLSLEGKRIVLDCANGANYKVAPHYFKELGADVIVIGDSPNGQNINLNCGSTCLKTLKERVEEENADFGFAFDGDADRCLAISENGHELDGDRILYMIGTKMKDLDRLKKDMVVVTTMSNLGLEKAFNRAGINFYREDVGDRYVLKRMLDCGYNLGGEQSGHIIMLDKQSTGDGLLTAATLADIFVSSSKTPSELASPVKTYPQVLVNAYVDLNAKDSYLNNPAIASAVKKTEEKYKDSGRVVIRPSGTQPMIRVMIEGNDLEEIKSTAVELKDLIEEQIGTDS